MRIWLLAALCAIPALAHAQADVGLVNLVSGEVVFVAGGGPAAKVTPFMKVREGDRFDLPAGAQLRVVYFEGARQERWQGPSSFRAARTAGTPLKGAAAEATRLPAGVPGRIARVPELMQNAKLGGIQLRGLRPEMTAIDLASLREARETYDRLKGQLPRDDITAELFLYSALEEFRLYDEMRGVVEEMERKQPQSEDVQALAAYVKARSKR
jgi:hypothetical protein